MVKRLTLICLLSIFAMAVKAQTTLCYHYYKSYDKFDVPCPRNSYQYFTFNGNYLYESEADGGYQIGYNGKRLEFLYKYTGKDASGNLMYVHWGHDYNYIGNWQKYALDYKNYILVSEDYHTINMVFKGNTTFGGYTADPWTKCYERCPNKDCDKTNVPAMKQ